VVNPSRIKIPRPAVVHETCVEDKEKVRVGVVVEDAVGRGGRGYSRSVA
jgi:hypothetical protein